MSYRRLFVMRKDLKMSPGKLAAQVSHCAEAYWTHLLRRKITYDGMDFVTCSIHVDKEIFRIMSAARLLRPSARPGTRVTC